MHKRLKRSGALLTLGVFGGLSLIALTGAIFGPPLQTPKLTVGVGPAGSLSNGDLYVKGSLTVDGDCNGCGGGGGGGELDLQSTFFYTDPSEGTGDVGAFRAWTDEEENPYFMWAGDDIRIVPWNNETASLTLNDNPVYGVESGAGTLVFDTACTVDYEVDYKWHKVGNQVTILFTNADAACTGDATGFSTAAGALPEALRPVTNGRNFPMICNGQNNGSGVDVRLDIATDGQVTARLRSTVAGAWSSTWTASGNRSLTIANHAITYLVD